MRKSETPKLEPEKDESSLALPVAAAAAVAMGTLGLVAWARRKSRRRSDVGPRPQRPAEPSASNPSRGEAGLMPEGVEGEARSLGAHIVVTDAFGPGARARVYGRGDWVAAVSGAAPLPEPAYEVNRPSAEAAQLSAMAYVRATQNEQEES